jgi:heme o synthase
MNEQREASHRPSVSNLDAKRPHGTAGMDRLKQRRPALLDPGLGPMSSRGLSSGDAKRAAVLAPMGRDSATGAFGVSWRDYLDLCKPRVVSLVVFTALVSMCLALPAGPIDWRTLLAGTLGIALAAASAAAFNHVADRDIDAMMRRTRRRPLPTHALEVHQALIFALALGSIAMLLLWVTVNPLTAVLALFTLIGYAVVYTRWLKWLTPQNIVLGGASGAAPAILGWTTVTGEVQAPAIALFLIVFVWTPAHFWPLAIARRDEYAAAGVPMLPVTHGVDFTRRRIFAYSIALVPISLLPCVTGPSGILYGIGALILGLSYVRRAWAFMRDEDDRAAMPLFRYSITYLTVLFALMLADRWLGML